LSQFTRVFVPSTASSARGQADIIGPFVRFGTLSSACDRWTGSILIIVRSAAYPRAPLLIIQENANYGNSVVPISLPRMVEAVELDRIDDWVFYRYNVDIELAVRFEKSISYHILSADSITPTTLMNSPKPVDDLYVFHVPMANTAPHWMFFSCNGTQNAKLGEPLTDNMDMWKDVMRVHEAQPFHMMAGLGDQLYNDNCLEIPDVKAWMERLRYYGYGFQSTTEHNLNERQAEIMSESVVTDHLKNELMRFFFNQYVQSFTHQEVGRAMAQIPQVMIWDDHDIFDGYGSYYRYIQQAPMVKAIYSAARRFYYLFQHNSTETRLLKQLDNAEMFTNGRSFSFLKLLDPQTVLVGVDMRSERSVDRIVASDVWQQVMGKLKNDLLLSCKHVILITPVPIIWPSLNVAETALSSVASLNQRFHLQKIFASSSTYQTFMYPFGQAPQLLDDVQDQWSARSHTDERRYIVNLLQGFATERGIRVTFVAGDSHTAGIGRFRTIGSERLRQAVIVAGVADQAVFDPRTMYCITSSAIVNEPPPDSLIKS
jgi:hypothetical protein